MSTDTQAPWLDAERVEEALLDASQGNQDAELRILEILKQAPEGAAEKWPEEIRQTWLSGIEFLVEEWGGAPCSATRRELALAAGRTGLDNVALRDLLAAEARRRFTDYLDPAGMIEALGVVSRDVPIAAVVRRWNMFGLLAKGTPCIHSVHGIGRIAEVDDIANQVVVRFDKKVPFATKAFLESVVLVRPDTTVDWVCRGKLSPDQALEKIGDRQSLMHDLVSAVGGEAEALDAVLGATSVAAPKAKEPARAEESGGGRSWDEARSLQELLEILRSAKRLELREHSASATGTLLSNAAERQEYATEFAEAVSRLWALTPQHDWLLDILSTLTESAWCWASRGHFVAVTDDLPGRLLPAWLSATRDALGPDVLAGYGSALPLRLWPQVEKALQTADQGREKLAAAAVRAVRADPGSADAAVWLWKSKRPERAELADSALIFRILALPVSGSFIKASKSLRKLLLEDESFQRFLLHDGEDAAVSALVQCARGLSVLSSGETQSLLVRIVRLFPDAKRLVEKREKAKMSQRVLRITSMRSYEKARQELQAIINVRTPENSRAIAHARSYGDLRENAEYKAAKEEQAYLTARRHELETALADIQPTDFTEVVPEDRVVPGCTVTLTYPDGSHKPFHLMGLWDSDPDRSILSYDTPLGKLLLGKALQETVTVPSGEEATVERIDPLSPELLEWAIGEVNEDR